MPDATIAIVATFTAEPVKESLSFFMRQLSLPAEVQFAPYNQVFQQLLSPSSLLASNQHGVNIVLVRLEDWGRYQIGDGGESVFPATVSEDIERSVSDFVQAMMGAALRSAVPYLVILCPPSRAARLDAHLCDLLDRMAAFVAAELEKIKGVHFISPESLAATYPLTEYDDPQGNRLGHIPYTRLFFAALGALIARRIYRLQTVPYKVVVLDCDQTLWKGVCGEDGALGIEVDPPRRALQEFMVQQHTAGMLLCLCSKNNEEDVFEVFERRGLEMPLKRDHILAWRINWRPKSENLRALAAELNLGLESFIFIDDDPAVCAEVQANCPEVLTLQLPQETDDLARFLNHVWAFDCVKQTREDGQRTHLYRQNVERERLRAQVSNLQDFLASLQLKIEISPLRTEHVPRVSQLTQRTNQFNFTTIRRSEQEIRQLCQPGQAECLIVEVNDRFGDYGLVGIMIFQDVKPALRVDTFLLSCRALGRGVEHKMLAQLGALARERGLDYIDVAYLTTQKNRPAFDFLSQLAVKEEKAIEGGTLFRIPAGFASTLTFNAERRAAPSPSPADEISQRAQTNMKVTATPKLAALRAIALGLTDARQILEAVQGEQAKPPRAASVPCTVPQDEVESKLKGIWEEILNFRPVGVEHNFFDLGGDSILAVRLFSEIEKAFERHLPLVTLLEAPTIRQLADLLREDANGNRWSSLVPIQPHGSRPPFYCMHAAGGNVLFYRDLAKHLGLEQPLYGLQARGVNRNQTNHTSVEEMAAYYLDEIRTLQPEGPYYLGGSSFGGLVAFEMARQLEEQGQSVGLLALFDTYGPGYPQPLRNTSSLLRIITGWRERVRTVRESLALLGPRDKVAYVVTKAGKAKRKLFRRFEWKTNEIAIKFSSATGRPLPKDIQRNHKAIAQALRDYKPQIYGGRLSLFRAARQPLGIVPDATLGWNGLALGGLDIHEVPGFHGAVTVDPHAKFLAEKLIPCLTLAQQGYEKKPFALSLDNMHDADQALCAAGTALGR